MPPQHRPFASHPCATSHPGLIAQAQTYLALAIGSGTRRTYGSGVNSYISFVTTHRIPTAFSASIETLCLWISWLAARSLTFGTCKVYLAAVINRHAEMGLVHPLTDAPPHPGSSASRRQARYSQRDQAEAAHHHDDAALDAASSSPAAPPRCFSMGHDVDSYGWSASHL